MLTNRRINRQILSIAIISAVGFAAFLSLNYQITRANTRAAVQLNTVYYPTLKSVDVIRSSADHIREVLNNAATDREPLFVEDAAEEARLLKVLIHKSTRRYPDFADEFSDISRRFSEYFAEAKQQTSRSINNAESAPVGKNQTTAINQNYSELRSALIALQSKLETDYQDKIDAIERDMRHTVTIGTVAGGITLLATLFIGYVVARRITRGIIHNDKRKDSFLDAISHELQTPMHGIGGTLAILETYDLAPEPRMQLNIADQAFHEMQKKIDEILIFLDLQTQRAVLHESNFCLWDALQPVFDRSRSLSHQKLLEFNLDFDMVKTQYYIGDSRKLLFIVEQLASNAIKFTQKGYVALALREHNQKLIMRVTDSGIGIGDEEARQLYEPFHRIDQSRNRQRGGLGIGLAICKQLVEIMHGSIQYQRNSNGHGSVFCVELPMRKSSPPETTIDASIEPPDALRALIVEDNQVNQMILVNILKRFGCITRSANDGNQAIELIANEHFDVVFMDCQMPVMDGFETTQKIRNEKNKNHRVPIIAVTANVMTADRERCLAAGMNDYLPKPFNATQIKQKLVQYGRHYHN